MKLTQWIGFTVLCAASTSGLAEYPEPQEGNYVINNFTFESGEVLPEMNVAYMTIGDPSGAPVLITHGTTGSGKSMLGEAFSDNLYGPGQPLDAEKYYLILVDAIGAGNSSKPSDGMRAEFPEQTLLDMVNAQKMLLTDHLGIERLHVKIGFSMGGYVDMDLAYRISRLHGWRSSYRLFARAHGRKKLDDASHGHRCCS